MTGRSVERTTSGALECSNRNESRSLETSLLYYCGSERWAKALLQKLYRSGVALGDDSTTDELQCAVLIAASEAFDALQLEDWMAAIAAHPHLGGGPEKPLLQFPSCFSSASAATTSLYHETKTASLVQSWTEQTELRESLSKTTNGIDHAGLQRQLSQLNTAYLNRHGFKFLMFAPGSSAADIVCELQRRISRTTEEEFQEAKWQQRRITWYRLRHLPPGIFAAAQSPSPNQPNDQLSRL